VFNSHSGTSVPVELQHIFALKCFFIPYILHDHQGMPEAFPSIGEMWQSKSGVEYHPEFELPPQEALLQSEILFLGAFFLHGRRAKGRSARSPGSELDMVRSSGRSPQISFHPLCNVWLGIVSV
jgi:hypothetical protein